MGFSPDWLSLREPADRAARDPALLAAAADAAGPAPVVVDLGCGTGSMRRALDARLEGAAQWRLVDNDPTLLEVAVASAPDRAKGYLMDLDRIEDLPLDGAALVTASALLDLVSRSWLDRLADRLAQQKLPLHAGLSYDGMMDWDPPLPSDAAITEAFNRDQRSDKGLGPSLGPDGAATAAQVLQTRGFAVTLADSPWHLGPGEAALHRDLLAGIAAAAERAGAAQAPDWLAERLEMLDRSRVRIGHVDLLALPPAPVPEEGG